MNSFIRKSLRNMESYKALNRRLKSKLDANENPCNIFTEFKDSFIKELEGINLNRYPDPAHDLLREMLTEYTGIDKECIICGNGSDEIIQMIVNTFADAGDYIVQHTPTFPMYEIYALAAGAKVASIPGDEKFNIDTCKIIEKANEIGAKIIFLCNPNNPTGTLILRKNIIEVIEKTECIVVVDEAYYEFSGETVIDEINKYDRLIVIRTLSKAFGIAGARVGYAAAGKNTIEMLYKIKSPYNINSLSQAAAIVVLRNVEKIKRSVETILKEKEFLMDRLTGIKGIEAFESSANFILIRINNLDRVIEALEDEGIGVKCYKNAAELQGCIRLTVGTRDENERFINILKRVNET